MPQGAPPQTATISAPAPPSLWRNPDFLKLWTGRTVSGFGSQISRLALPLTAANLLQATPAQMGFLQAAATAPPLVLGLVAGVWVDRFKRRPVLIATDLGRALLLAAVPALAALRLLGMEHLILLALLTGVLTLFFDVASTSFIPSFLPRARLVDANSKLSASSSVAQVAGPSLAGTLVGLLTAPVAVAVDALSFLVSAVCNAMVGAAEPPPRPAAPTGAPRGRALWRELWDEVLEGLRVVGGNTYMRTCAGTAGVFNFFAGVSLAVYVLYATRELGLSAPVLGLLYAVGGAGSILGALVAGPLVQRVGFGPATAGAACLVGVGWLPVALTAGGTGGAGVAWATIPLLAGSHFVRGISQTVYGINSVSLRQAAVPDHLQGRVAGTLRVVFLGTAPLGSLAGGLLGERIGLWPTLAFGAAGALLGTLWMVLSPVRSLDALPTAADEGLLAEP